MVEERGYTKSLYFKNEEEEAAVRDIQRIMRFKEEWRIKVLTFIKNFI